MKPLTAPSPATPTGAEIARLLAVAACAAATALLVSCEERVIKASGPGADSVRVSEPFYDTPKWEKAIFGDPNPERPRN